MLQLVSWCFEPSQAVATVLLTKTFIVKYYDRRIQTNAASIIIIITHVKRDGNCNGEG